ncbi:MAG: aspartate aminotransferase family protein, partial [Rufibacter sp.]
PIAMAAGMAALTYLNEHLEVYTHLQQVTDKMVNGTRQNMQQLGLKYTLNQVGSMFSLFFTQEPVTDFASAKTSDLALFGRYFHEMLQRGIYLAPSQFETLFVSNAVTVELAEQYIVANLESLQAIYS